MRKYRGTDRLETLRMQIFKAMDKNGWTQTMLADFCKVSRREVANIVGREKDNIKLETLERFANGLGLKMSDLVE